MTSSRYAIAGLAALVVLLTACEVSTPPPPSRIGGAQFITFRCAPRVQLPARGFPELGRAGAPLDGCGCTQFTGEGALGFLQAASCAVGNAEVRAYVAGNSVGEVAAIRLNRGARTGEALILDSDETIPGVTGIHVDDIISDIEADPDGRFVISVNATSGTLAIIVDDFAINPDLVLEPGVGPLAAIAVWPPIERPLTRDGDSVILDGGRKAWVTAPAARRILEIDLDAVAALLAAEAAEPISAILDMPDGAVPAELAVHPDGDRIYVGHAAESAITVFDLSTGEPTGRIDLSRRTNCDDPYLTGVIDRVDDRSCADGFDNDEDGQIDGDDPDCGGPWGIEWPNPACPQLAECADGVDNNGDGLIDGDDPACGAGSGRWEGDPPACANGIDDDGDGAIDRADVGCTTEAGRDELPIGDGLESGDQCLDGIDNDGDGLIDLAEDPGCSDTTNAALRYPEERSTACADGFDNDGDGVVDYAGGDGDCYAASDDAEGGSRIELGPSEIVTARFIINGRVFDYLYTTEAVGYVVAVDLDDPNLQARYTGLDRPSQSMALRQRAGTNSILSMVSDGSLRSMEITTPAQLRTVDGRDVFARLGSVWDAFDDASLQGSGVYDRGMFRHVGIRVEAFYAIEAGSAGRITALDDACPGGLPDEAGACPTGRSPLFGLCAPDPCAADSDCPGGFACLDGFCAQACAADAECGSGELCDPVIPVENKAPLTVCRTRCRLDDRGLVQVAPPRDPCAGGACGAGCDGSEPCGADLTCVEGTCQAWCSASSCDAPFDPQTAPIVMPGVAGRALGDPLAMRADRSWIVHDEVNVLRFARARTPRVSADPRTFVRTAPVSVNFGRYPAFCRIPQPTDTAAFPGWPVGDCVPQGRTLGASGVLVNQTDEQRSQETRHRVDSYPFVQVLEDRPGRLASQEFALSYEAVLPRSESRTGQHAGVTPVSLDAQVSRTGEAQDVAGWVLIDYEQDFCDAGVEVGDMLLIDRMVPIDPEDEAVLQQCAAFLGVDTALPPDQRREPLRYRVAEVGPFKLVLRPDGTAIGDTLDYSNMLRRDDRQAAPALAAPRPAPPVACMSGLSTYRVRAAESFLLIGAQSGYRHPWVRRGGECVADPQRAERRSRAQLGVPFENEWFRFQLGPANPDLLADDPADGPTLPFLVDVVLTFPVSNGALIRRISGMALTPQGMRWLPNNDLLYIVDGTIQTLVEISGLDVLRSEFAVSNASYD